jgi:hypothetical protein
MRQKIKQRIEKLKIESEFQIQIIPARKRHRRPHPDYVKETLRDENGNHIASDGHIVLRDVRTDMGKTLTPSEQYRKSKLFRRIQGE